MGKAVWKVMLKLVKYELRKNRTALLVLLAVIAAIEAYFSSASRARRTRT